MNELSKNQLHYLNMRRRHKRIVAVSRVSILLAFLFLWEFAASTGLIDSFIFSSPSRIALCFLEMTGDGSIFPSYRSDSLRNLGQFHPGNLLQPFCHRPSLALSEAFGNPGALSGGAEQPAKIRPCPASHRLARRKPHNHHHCRNVRCDLRRG